MSDVNKLVPTNDELRAIIEKVAEFMQAIVSLFSQLKAGLAETFSKYEAVFPDAAEEEE